MIYLFTLPTVATESVFITTVIDAHEGCNVACFDIRGRFCMLTLTRTLPWSSRVDWQS